MTRDGTPVEGVPAVPEPVARTDTGPLSTQMVAAMRDVGTHDDSDPERFLDALATKLAQKTGNGPPPKTFLGLSGGAWTKVVIGYLIAAMVGVFLWWLAVRDGLAERPTRNEVNTSIDNKLDAKVDRHTDRPHPDTDKRLVALEREQKTIRESQIRQESNDRAQSAILSEIKDDVKRLRRRRGD